MRDKYINMLIENANNQNSKQIRVLERLLEIVTSAYESANGGVNRSLYLLENLEKRLALEIRGVFTANELKCILDANNGTMISEPFWGSQRAMVIQMQDGDEYDRIGEKWGVSIAEICTKIQQLSPAAFLYFHEEIYRFWNEPPAYGSPAPELDFFIEKYSSDDTPNE